MSNDLKAQIVKADRRQWTNVHRSITEKIEALYKVRNPDVRPSVKGLRATTEALQSLIAEAITDGKRLRALGSGWSLSRAPVTRGRLLTTAPMNWRFPISSRSVVPGIDPSHLSLVQCGMTIEELHEAFRPKQRSLQTSGASNGQTIVGAMSTGTHGSGLDVGSLQDYVYAMHLIVGPDRHVWLERASHPVMVDGFASRLGAELIRDDTLFNAALVSFGSFGIIHAVVVETEPLFLLEADRKKIPWDDTLRRAVDTLDFSGVPFFRDNERPYYVRVVLNPHDPNGDAYVDFMYKHDYEEPYDRGEEGEGSVSPGDDALTVIGTIGKILPPLIPGIANALFSGIYKEFERPQWGTLSETFGPTSIQGAATGVGMGVPGEWTSRALDTLIAVHEEHGPLAGVFALRFVMGSDALLAFTRFERTCVVDMDGPHNKSSLKFFRHAWKAFDDAQIPYTLHWGKNNQHLNAERVRRMYGDDVDRWIASRERLLDAPTRQVFTNRFMERCGLAT